MLTHLRHDAVPTQVVQGLAMLGQAETLPEAIEASHASRRPPRLSVNGCIILKAMLSMPQSACRAVTDALVALDSASAEFLAADPSGARVLETLLKVSAPLMNTTTSPRAIDYSWPCTFMSHPNDINCCIEQQQDAHHRDVCRARLQSLLSASLWGYCRAAM